MDTMKQKLQELRDLLADPTHFTTRAFARNVEGQKVSPCSDEAVCWCLLGGIKKLDGPAGWHRSPLYDYLYNHRPWRLSGLAEWADLHGHAAVLEFLDKLIADAGEEAAEDGT